MEPKLVTVALQLADGVATLTLDSPATSNALSMTMAREIDSLIPLLAHDDVRVVVVRGAGPRFCAGGDLTTFLGSSEPATALHELATLVESAVRELGDLPAPVVVGVHGAVAGAGLSFVLNADIVVAARSTRFVAGYPGVGLTPDAGVSWMLPRAVGMQRALKHLLLNESLTADEAERWGLVAEVVDDADVVSRTQEIAARLAGTSVRSVAETKRLVRQSSYVGRAEHAVDEAATISAALMTSEAHQAIARFTTR